MLVNEEKKQLCFLQRLKYSYLGVNQDFSKNYVRITMKIPQMKTGLNWRKFIREAKNGSTTKAAYHGTYVSYALFYSSRVSLFSRVSFEFVLNQGKPTEMKYEFSSREPLRGLIEYNKSYLKVMHLTSQINIRNGLFSLSIKMIMSSGSYTKLNPGENVLINRNQVVSIL